MLELLVVFVKLPEAQIQPKGTWRSRKSKRGINFKQIQMVLRRSTRSSSQSAKRHSNLLAKIPPSGLVCYAPPLEQIVHMSVCVCLGAQVRTSGWAKSYCVDASVHLRCGCWFKNYKRDVLILTFISKDYLYLSILNTWYSLFCTAPKSWSFPK